MSHHTEKKKATHATRFVSSSVDLFDYLSSSLSVFSFTVWRDPSQLGTEFSLIDFDWSLIAAVMVFVLWFVVIGCGFCVVV